MYNYSKIEKQVKLINDLIKDIQSYSLSFFGFAMSGLLFFEYGNFSLTIFYFDLALKTLARYKNYMFHPSL